MAGNQDVIVAEMFIMFISYVGLQIYYFIVYGFNEQDEIGVASLPAPILSGTGKWNNHDFKRDFSLWFDYHIICASVAIMYSPWAFAVIFAWVHLGAYIATIVLIFISCTPNTFRLPWYIMAACNIVLIIAGLTDV